MYPGANSGYRRAWPLFCPEWRPPDCARIKSRLLLAAQEATLTNSRQWHPTCQAEGRSDFGREPPAERALQAATATIPIVVGDLESDPVADRFVASIARPGGNLTGVFLDFPDSAKNGLSFLKVMLPQLTKVAVFWDPTTVKRQLDAVKSAADVLGLVVDNDPGNPDIADAQAAFSTSASRVRAPRSCCHGHSLEVIQKRSPTWLWLTACQQ